MEGLFIPLAGMVIVFLIAAPFLAIAFLWACIQFLIDPKTWKQYDTRQTAIAMIISIPFFIFLAVIFIANWAN